MPRAMVLNAKDNVGTLIDTVSAGERVTLTGARTDTIEVREGVPFGHKCALDRIASGDDIIKYGQVIGRAIHAIAPGHHVHVHNVEALRGRGDLTGDGE